MNSIHFKAWHSYWGQGLAAPVRGATEFRQIVKICWEARV